MDISKFDEVHNILCHTYIYKIYNFTVNLDHMHKSKETTRVVAYIPADF